MALDFLRDQKSPNFKRKQNLMQTLELPTMSEAKQLLGSGLAGIIIKQCPDELKKDFGVEPPLKGAGDELWTSPSDLLIGKVCLKPPLTQKHIQALSHQGILEIGWKIEKKFYNEMKLEKERELRELEKYLKYNSEVEKNRLVEQVREEERAKYLEELNCLIKYYEKIMEERVAELTEEMVRLEIELRTENEELNIMWQEKLEEEVAKTINRMNEELLEKLRDQELLLARLFNEKFANLKSKKKCAIEFERTQCKEAMMQLKHNLECRNIANMIYVLTKERKKCSADKKALEAQHREEVRKLNTTIRQKSSKIKQLLGIQAKKTRQIEIREKCLAEILRQYQKLINFALKATPTQAEFLLDLERILSLKMDEACYKKKKTKQECVEKPRVITEKDLEHDAIEEIQKYIAEGELTNINNEQDYESDEYLAESNELPAFYFNDKMYIREDFRDMLATGIKIERHHPLWNQDVEELMDKFNCQLEKIQRSDHQILSRSKSHPSSVHFHYDDHEEQLKEKEIQQKEKEENNVISSNKYNMDTKKSILSNSPQTSVINDSQFYEIRKKSASLVQAVDSVELIKNLRSESRLSVKNKKERETLPASSKETGNRRSSLKTNKEYSELNDFVAQAKTKTFRAQSKLALARDSVILRISSMERKSLMNAAEIKTEDTKQTPETKEKEDVVSMASLSANTADNNRDKAACSKLLLANDSLELIMKSVSKVSPNITEPKELDAATVHQESRKSQLTFNLNIEKVEIAPEKITKTNTKSYNYNKTRTKLKSVNNNNNKKAKCKILGDRQGVKLNPEEFTNERINSLVNLLKDDSSLLRLFTACAK